jgi:ketosteroid isomerase-like protein
MRSNSSGGVLMNHRETDAGAVAAVLRLEGETMRAIERRDVAALGRLLAEEFVYRTPFGADAGGEEFLKNVAAMPFEILSVRGEGVRAEVYGESAVVTGVQRASVRTAEGEEAESLVAFTDVFVRRGGEWRMALAYGVELPPPAPPAAADGE